VSSLVSSRVESCAAYLIEIRVIEKIESFTQEFGTKCHRCGILVVESTSEVSLLEADTHAERICGTFLTPSLTFDS